MCASARPGSTIAGSCERRTRLRSRSAIATTSAIGYIDASHDEGMISIDGAQLYREDIMERRRVRLATFGIELDDG